MFRPWTSAARGPMASPPGAMPFEDLDLERVCSAWLGSAEQGARTMCIRYTYHFFLRNTCMVSIYADKHDVDDIVYDILYDITFVFIYHIT